MELPMDNLEAVHKFGNHDQCRYNFLKKAVKEFSSQQMTTNNFSISTLKNNEQLPTAALKMYYHELFSAKNTKTFSNNPDDIDVTRLKVSHDGKSSDNSSVVCRKCGYSSADASSLSSLVTKYRVKPKSKTSKTVLRLLKTKNSKPQSYMDSAKFKRNVINHYFNSCNKVTKTCVRCGASSLVAKGEKRANESFIDRHSSRHKKNRQARKAAHQTKKDSRPVAPTGSANSEVVSHSSNCDVFSTASPSSARVDKIKSTLTNSQRKTRSPMQSFKTDTDVVSKVSTNPKHVVQHRVTNKSSASVIRKFQQSHLSNLIKTDQKRKSGNKSSLQTFLHSMK